MTYKTFLTFLILFLSACAVEPLDIKTKSDLSNIQFQGTASPLNTWRISCIGQDQIAPTRGVDKGALTYVKSEASWVFTKSRNYCKGGFFSQRSELVTDKISPKSKKAYLFETDISFTSNTNNQFTIFQVHDSRDGCAPPASLNVMENGTLWIASDVKIGAGEQCIRGRLGANSKGKIARDGTVHNLRVFLDFNGSEGFAISVWLDGDLQISETYSPQNNSYKSDKYYLKHGVYSLEIFDYKLISKNMKVAEVDL